MKDKILEHIEVLVTRYPVLETSKAEIIAAYQIIEKSYKNGGKLLVAGNGGSAADAEHIVNTYINNVTMSETVEAIEQMIAADKKSYVVAINVDVVMKIEDDPYLKKVVDDADMVLVDGKPLVWISKLHGKPLKAKISGSDLVPLLCEVAAEKGYKVFIIGGKDGIAAQAKEKLESKHPKIQIVGTYAPPFGFEKNEKELNHINQMISDVKPDLLIACFGCPKQEKWIYENIGKYDAKVSVCAGATVDFLAGNVKRAPRWMSEHGLEWFYRFTQEPKRMFMYMIKICEKEERYVNSSAYKMSISILYQWALFYKKHGWNDELVKRVDSFLVNYDADTKGMDVGYRIMQKQELTVNGNTAFDEVVKTRRAVRTFSDKKLEPNIVKECILLAQAAPTACNRQMIKIYQVSNRENCDVITDTIYGASGFTRDTVNYFVLTYDVKSLDYYGERNQGYLNAGLVAMNLANALHSRGIGSCFIQWANTASEEQEVKNHLGISKTEHIAVVLGAGYYADEMYIAKSCRRDMEEIFTSM